MSFTFLIVTSNLNISHIAISNFSKLLPQYACTYSLECSVYVTVCNIYWLNCNSNSKKKICLHSRVKIRICVFRLSQINTLHTKMQKVLLILWQLSTETSRGFQKVFRATFGKLRLEVFSSFQFATPATRCHKTQP